MSGEREDPEATLAESLVGRTITRARWFDESPDETWNGHETAWLWLDDGRVIEFGGYGYDAWGATISEIRVVDVERCDHCGARHENCRVCEGWGSPSDRYPNVPFVWCSDGHHVAALVAEKSS